MSTSPNKRSRGASSSRRELPATEFAFLPEHVLFQILILLPADFLHLYGRYVCKAWLAIISDKVFINEHFKRSKNDLFFQITDNPSHGINLYLKEGGFEEGPVNGLFSARLLSISRGVALFYEVPPQNVMRVANLFTRRFATLPSPLSRREGFISCHITFVPQTLQYKVVYCVRFCKARKWRVWTLGYNQSWRNLEISSTLFNLETKVEKTSASAGGVLYLSKGRGAISAINLNLEIGHLVQIPNEFVDKPYWIHEMGNSLSCGVNQKGEIHVYMLKDLITSEWLKIYKFKEIVDKKRFRFRTIVPVGWLRNGEKFIFMVREPGYWKNRYIVAYDVQTGDSVIHLDDNFGVIHVHSNSLASW